MLVTFTLSPITVLQFWPKFKLQVPVL